MFVYQTIKPHVNELIYKLSLDPISPFCSAPHATLLYRKTHCSYLFPTDLSKSTLAGICPSPHQPTGLCQVHQCFYVAKSSDPFFAPTSFAELSAFNPVDLLSCKHCYHLALDQHLLFFSHVGNCFAFSVVYPSSPQPEADGP